MPPMPFSPARALRDLASFAANSFRSFTGMSPARGPSQARGPSSARGPIETPTDARIVVTVKIVDLLQCGIVQHTGSGMLAQWCKNIGANVYYDCGAHSKVEQLGFACGVVAVGSTQIMKEHHDTGGRWRTHSMANAASLEFTRKSYDWLEARGQSGQLDFNPDVFSSGEKRPSQLIRGIRTLYLEPMDMHNLLARGDASEDVLFEDNLTAVRSWCAIGSRNEIQLKIARAIAAKKEGFFHAISNAGTDESRGYHWFAVAFEISKERE